VRLATSIIIVQYGGKNLNQRYRPRKAKRERLGLPETLKIIQYEKKISTVSTKLEPSLKRYLLEHGGSSRIRELILRGLTRDL
jgi:hypothetical protein